MPDLEMARMNASKVYPGVSDALFEFDGLFPYVPVLSAVRARCTERI
jgi:hypothetical protein